MGNRPAEPRCSRRDCHADATWALVWNNPALHTPDRRKVWTACDEHRQYLSNFLDVRGFLREVVAMEEYRER
ncbi:hypothetical protein [Nocardiopsis sp. CNR-923]|uniref:hypothetical protein n=1 Tax=Nocardiopsis sp. CNR-923 TaxID=1904965 RepID=UPI00096AAE18|nr:hypothetical protein [Nocardiopsis sp. CNR-923]